MFKFAFRIGLKADMRTEFSTIVLDSPVLFECNRQASPISSGTLNQEEHTKRKRHGHDYREEQFRNIGTAI